MNRYLIALVITCLIHISSAYGVTTAGRVTFVSGTPKAINKSGSQRPLEKGQAIFSGDTIDTKKSLLQVKFTDGTFMSFNPNSRFQIEEYRFNGKQDGTEKSSYKLLKGGLRTVTGLIGKKNRKAYRLRASVATIGIRGTKFYLELDNGLIIYMGEDGALEINDGTRILFLTAHEVASIGGKDAVVNLIKSGDIEALGPIGQLKIPGGWSMDSYVVGDQVNCYGKQKSVSSSVIIQQ
ncbi:MAG: hypothetical protein GY814_01195 [Gammaproteobacteria bacterium]|nr:hypothetical protein [Gammaproteobacteria bacterium]